MSDPLRFSRRPITPAQQAFWLRRSAVALGRGYQHLNRLSWSFAARPTAVSREYHLRLEYRTGGVPELYVFSPDLVALAGDRRLPHVYSQSPTRLCLYLPGTGEWHSSMLLATSVVPWAYLWLFYFEEWLSSGEWKGGGVHPPAGVADETPIST